MKNWFFRLLRVAWSVIAFVVSVYAVSNLLPLVLHTVESELSVADGFLIIEYLLTTSFAILILAREIYRLDWKAGRIRNRVRCFE